MHFLKQNSEIFQKFKKCKVMVEKQKRRNVKFLRLSNGGEYTSMKFKEYLGSEGIKHQLSILGRPEQNGVAERMNQILAECARSMRSQADILEGFWAEAVSHVSYSVNMLSSTAVDLQISNGEESQWIIQPYIYLAAWHTVID